jgi:hypothetical protein
MKNAFLCACLLLLFFVSETQGQNYIGLDKSEVRSLARKSGFFPDHLTTSQKFNYLKFVNTSDTKTLIVFFSDIDVSTHSRLVCDYSEYDFIIDEYNKKYTKKGKNTWIYRDGRNSYEVTLEEKEWYFVVTEKKSR